MEIKERLLMKTTVKQKIDLLESQGYKVHLKHLRRDTQPIKFDEVSPLSPLGGTTVAIIKQGEDIVAKGVAKCSDQDNYNKKIGANIALGRALRKLRLA